MELKLTPRFLQNGQRFFGPGVAELLERVREHRSLRAAAASMEMAYSKAWRIIHEAAFWPREPERPRNSCLNTEYTVFQNTHKG